MIKRKKLSERIRQSLMDLERQQFLENSVLSIPRNISHGNLSNLDTSSSMMDEINSPVFLNG